MKQKNIRYLSLLCLIGMIISLQCGTLAADPQCYAPDGDENYNYWKMFHKDNKWFYAGKYQRWVWAGTSTWLVVNDFDKEILILDGYASKATLGNNRNNYMYDYNLTRLTRFANVIRGFCELEYKIVGIMVAHNHLDHTMDLGALIELLNADEGVIIDDKDVGLDVSEIPTEFGPAVFSDDFKVVSAWNVADEPTHAQGYPILRAEGYEGEEDLVNYYLLFKDENGDYIQKDISCASENIVCAQRCDTDVKFSKEADLYHKNPDGDDELVTVECDNPDLSICDDPEASIALGHFAIQVVLWPHWDVPVGGGWLLHAAHGWSISLNIWHSEAPDARRVFITTSSGDNPEDIPDEVTIWTDHLIYAWPNIATSNARERIATIAKDHVRFFASGEEPAFIFANHYDPNGPIDSEDDEAEELEARFNKSYYGNDSLSHWLLEQGAIETCSPYNGEICWHDTNRILKFGAYPWEVLGMAAMDEEDNWYDSKVEVFYDTDCDGSADNEDNCPNDANSEQEDNDNDGTGDVCDTCTDTDGDTYGNPGFSANTCLDDNCPDFANADQADEDNDGTGDVCDTCTDTDGDTYGNPGFSANTCLDDNCPDFANADQADEDNDGTGDVCDTCTDTDGDTYGNPGFSANTCLDDNCPDFANADQADWDSDGLGDVCDDDIDGDGVLNENDECEFTPVDEVVDLSIGCSIEQLVPCEGPRGTTETWKNHGQYVSTLAKTTNRFMKDGLITEEEKEAIMAVGASSDCGK